MLSELESPMLVAGEWTHGARSDEVVNPFTSEVVAGVPHAGANDVERALAAAVEGARQMRALPAHERAAILNRDADLADERVVDLARTISREADKFLTEARGEAARAGSIMRVRAHEGAAASGETLPLDAHPSVGRARSASRCASPASWSPSRRSTTRSCSCFTRWGLRGQPGNAVVLEPAQQPPLAVEAAMVGVKIAVAAFVAWFPFSGWKNSIDGDLHANGRDAVEFYMRKKVVTSRWA